MKKKAPPIHNFVAKHAHDHNKAAVFIDRKKALKKGYSKHKRAFRSHEGQGYSIAA